MSTMFVKEPNAGDFTKKKNSVSKPIHPSPMIIPTTVQKSTKNPFSKPIKSDPKNRKIKNDLQDDPTSLVNYFKEIGSISLLSKEREKELGVKISLGDECALNELVRANLRFVVKIAKRYMHYGIPLTDLISEGNIGLINAARRFDYTRGCSFTTYAIWYIRQSIAKSVMQMNSIIAIPKKYQVLLKRLEQELEPENEHTLYEILKHEKVDSCQFFQLYNIKHHTIALDHISNQEDPNRSYNDILPDRIHHSPEDQMMDDSLRSVLEAMLNKLDPLEQRILCLKFGLNNHPCHTLREIADELHYSRERIRQIKLKAINKLRKLSATYMLQSYLN